MAPICDTCVEVASQDDTNIQCRCVASLISAGCRCFALRTFNVMQCRGTSGPVRVYLMHALWCEHSRIAVRTQLPRKPTAVWRHVKIPSSRPSSAYHRHRHWHCRRGHRYDFQAHQNENASEREPVRTKCQKAQVLHACYSTAYNTDILGIGWAKAAIIQLTVIFRLYKYIYGLAKNYFRVFIAPTVAAPFGIS